MAEFTDGTAKFKVTKSGGVLPGTVTAFSGTFNDGFPVDKNTGLVNREWHLCDGTNGTPDLRSRFIYGGDGTNNGATGGEESSKHGHMMPLGYDERKNFFITIGEDFEPPYGSEVIIEPVKMYNAGNTVFNGVNITNGPVRLAYTSSETVSHMPPYYVLAYIMKL